MSTISNELAARIKALPPLPESVVKIQDICSNPESGIADLAKVVEKDPMLTANLLKAANSPLYGFSREIHNVSQAVSLFGMATVKGFALASAVKNTVPIDMAPYGCDAARFSDVAQLQSALMLNWYKSVDKSKMDILAPASFLDGVGEIIMAAEIIKQGKIGEFHEAIQGNNLIEEVEIKYFDVPSMTVAAEVFTKWRLDALMVDAIAASHRPEEADDESVRACAYALKAVRCAVNLKESFTDAALANAKALLEEAGMDVELFMNAVKVVNP